MITRTKIPEDFVILRTGGTVIKDFGVKLITELEL